MNNKKVYGKESLTFSSHARISAKRLLKFSNSFWNFNIKMSLTQNTSLVIYIYTLPKCFLKVINTVLVDVTYKIMNQTTLKRHFCGQLSFSVIWILLGLCSQLLRNFPKYISWNARGACSNIWLLLSPIFDSCFHLSFIYISTYFERNKNSRVWLPKRQRNSKKGQGATRACYPTFPTQPSV